MDVHVMSLALAGCRLYRLAIESTSLPQVRYANPMMRYRIAYGEIRHHNRILVAMVDVDLVVWSRSYAAMPHCYEALEWIDLPGVFASSMKADQVISYLNYLRDGL